MQLTRKRYFSSYSVLPLPLLDSPVFSSRFFSSCSSTVQSRYFSSHSIRLLPLPDSPVLQLSLCSSSSSYYAISVLQFSQFPLPLPDSPVLQFSLCSSSSSYYAISVLQFSHLPLPLPDSPVLQFSHLPLPLLDSPVLQFSLCFPLPESRRDQEEGGELDADEETSAEEVKSREVELGLRVGLFLLQLRVGLLLLQLFLNGGATDIVVLAAVHGSLGLPGWRLFRGLTLVSPFPTRPPP